MASPGAHETAIGKYVFAFNLGVPLKFCVTGFVEVDSGSVASANGVLLRTLLTRGNSVDFFTKPSFVDPRPAVAGTSNACALKIVDCTNNYQDWLRRRLSPSGRGLWGRFWGSVDSGSYNRGLVRAMRSEPVGDLDLWLGDWARRRGNRPVVSYVQGPPGTDALSISKHRMLIERLAGKLAWLKLAAFARWRLSAGLPNFKESDHIILGSQWSRQKMIDSYNFTANRLHAVPYPIDLKMFRPGVGASGKSGSLKIMWLGRFVPRKRLDLFLNGMELAILNGCDVNALVVGSSGFVPNYERLLQEFKYPERLRHLPSVSRNEVPGILSDMDVMAQPSDDENFGSSVAEALACGIPAIVGATNGTGDYICDRSIRLSDDRPETMAAAIVAMADAKNRGELADPDPSRATAEKYFDPERVTDQLETILKLAASVNQ